MTKNLTFNKKFEKFVNLGGFFKINFSEPEENFGKLPSGAQHWNVFFKNFQSAKEKFSGECKGGNIFLLRAKCLDLSGPE